MQHFDITFIYKFINLLNLLQLFFRNQDMLKMRPLPQRLLPRTSSRQCPLSRYRGNVPLNKMFRKGENLRKESFQKKKR